MQRFVTRTSRRSGDLPAGVQTAYKMDGGGVGTDREQIAGEGRGAA